VRQNLPVHAEIDHQIVGALQINPRISWNQLGTILATDPTTLSRRWRRMTQDRVVWTTCFEVPPRSRPNPIRVGLVEVRTEPGRREEVIAALSRERLVYGIQCTSGDRDLAVMVSARSLMGIDAYVEEHITGAPGVTQTRTHYLHAIHRDGPSWRLGSLTPAQATAVGRTLPVRSPQSPPTPLLRELLDALNPDVRRPLGRLHESVGRSLSTVSRGVETLLSVDWAAWRIDLAHEHMGWEAEAWLWLRASGPDLPRLLARLNQLPHTRLSGSVSGEANVAVCLWLRELRELDLVQHQLSSSFSTLRVVDRWVVPRVAKRGGHVLDREGRQAHYIPIGVRPGQDTVPALG